MATSRDEFLVYSKDFILDDILLVEAVGEQSKVLVVPLEAVEA
jgi:hypothetical protein